MSLATAQDWIDDQTALLHVADVDGDGQPNHSEIERALEKAEVEMAGWLAARYPAYPSKALPTLRMHQIKMATHHLASTAQSSTDDIKDAYKASIDYLKVVAAGRADLPGTDQGGDSIDSGSGGVQMVAPERQFTRDNLKDM